MRWQVFNAARRRMENFWRGYQAVVVFEDAHEGWPS